MNGKSEKELKQKYYYQKAKSDMEFFIYGAALLIQYKTFAAAGAAAGLAAGVTVKGGGAAIAISVTGGGTVVVGAATATTAVTALTASGLLLLIGKDIGKVANRALEKGKEDIPKGYSETGNWNKGSYDSAEDSLNKHFKKHGAEVGAKTPEEYLRKAEEYAKTAKKGSTKSPVSGEVEGVIRYKKNGKYIHLPPDGSIISFGKQ